MNLGAYLNPHWANFTDSVAERFRPKLPVDQGVVAKEGGYNDTLRLREILKHILLVEGGLDELKQEYRDVGREGEPIAFRVMVNDRAPRRVSVSVDASSVHIAEFELRKKLKLSLHERNCNAGINYRVREKGNLFVAEAVPACITAEE